MLNTPFLSSWTHVKLLLNLAVQFRNIVYNKLIKITIKSRTTMGHSKVTNHCPTSSTKIVVPCPTNKLCACHDFVHCASNHQSLLSYIHPSHVSPEVIFLICRPLVVIWSLVYTCVGYTVLTLTEHQQSIFVILSFRNLRGKFLTDFN